MTNRHPEMPFFQKQQLRKIKSIQVSAQDALFSLNRLKKHPKVLTCLTKEHLYQKNASQHFVKLVTLIQHSRLSPRRSCQGHETCGRGWQISAWGGVRWWAQRGGGRVEGGKECADRIATYRKKWLHRLEIYGEVTT